MYVTKSEQVLKIAALFSVIFFYFCCLFVPVSPVFAAESSKANNEVVKKEKQLESLKREIIEKKKGLTYHYKKEYAILEEIERLDKALSKKEEELEKIEHSLARLKQKNNDVDMRIKELLVKREGLSQLLEKRLVAMYKIKKGGMVQTLLVADSVHDFGRKYTYINKIVEYDADLLKDYRDNQLSLDAEKERLKEFAEEMLSLKDALGQKRGEISEERNKKTALLSGIRKKKEIQLAALREMENASKELQLFLDTLKKDIRENGVGSQAVDFVSMRGYLPMPVDGKVISLYGRIEHPKFHTVTFNNGIEIEANSGAEVRSVYKGRVIYTGWFRGYGKVVIIDHGNGYYTLFARLSKIIKEVNSLAEKGDVIALVGDTGSLKGPHLYFEIRQKGVPLDPLNWLAYNK